MFGKELVHKLRSFTYETVEGEKSNIFTCKLRVYACGCKSELFLKPLINC